MAHHVATPPRTSQSLSRRSTATLQRQSRHQSVDDVLALDQHPPASPFDEYGFEEIILPPASALTARTTTYSAHPTFDDNDSDDSDDSDKDDTALSSTNTFLERCRNTALSIPTASAALTQNPRASLQARAKSIASLVPTWANRPVNAIQENSPQTPSEPKPRTRSTFGDLFAGSSAPVNFGVSASPEKEKPAMDWGMGSKSTTRPVSNRTTTNLSMNSVSKFSWFGTKAFNPSPTPVPSSRPQSSSTSTSNLNHNTQPDPLLTLTPETALFPHGHLDPLDPSSFNTLLQNAQLSISALQNGYRRTQSEIQSSRAEVSAFKDEAEEAETRARHLKLQLDNMAARVAEQEKAMKALADELAQERLIRREEEEARKRSVVLLRSKSQQFGRENENIGFDRERKDERRESRGTSICDSGFESDAESTVESVFSRPGAGVERDLASPLTAATTPLSTLNEWESDEVEEKTRRPSLPQRSSMVFGAQRGTKKKGMSLEDYVDRRLSSGGVGEDARDGCRNCMGGGQTNAWNLVGELRAENNGLNSRVVELERSVEGCLDLVRGLGM
ncbi:MAG: hypothetical protein M1820_010324 [Bogoriella megaspora]|nr:MAG: hypothetical protein M1820_010324 [Bogoriella megaspora]